MADTFTTTLNLTKPEVGASADTWGTKLNDNLDDIDALFSAGPVLKVANGGTAATTASGARTSLGLGTIATQDASAVAITGGTATLSTTTLSSTEPSLWFYESDAATDEKYWRFVSGAGLFYLQAWDDPIVGGSTPIAINRTGTTIDAIALTATSVTVNGNAVHHAGTFTAPASGSFTAYLRATNDGANLASGTATWKKFNGVVTLQLPALTTSTSLTDPMYVDGLPVDVCPVTTAQYLLVPGYNAGIETAIMVTVPVSGDYLLLAPFNTNAFTAGGTIKGIRATALTYLI